MRLNAKIGLTLGIPMLALVAVLGGVLHTVVTGRFIELEQREMLQNHERLLQALDSEFEELERLAVDWGEWDDTYRFLQGRNPDWTAINLTASTFDNLQLESLLIFDRDGQLHTGYAFDATERRLVEPAPAMVERIADLLAARADDSSPAAASGILEANGRVIELAMSPILSSDGDGEPLGTLLMLRSIDDNRVARLAQRIRLGLRLRPLATIEPGSAADRAVAGLDHDAVAIDATDATRLSAFSILRDLTGAPTLLMRVDMPRDVLREGRDAVFQLLAFTAAAMLLLGFGVFVAIREIALKRLSRIGRMLVGIGAGGSTDQRLPVRGNDEIDRLARSINAMLDGLDDAYAARRRHAERQRELNALLVQIATDEAAARGDEEALFDVLSQAFGQAVRPDRWSLWLQAADGGMPRCWRIGGAIQTSAPPAELVADELAHWDGHEGSVRRVGSNRLGPGRHALLLPFAVDQWQGALLIESLQRPADWPDDEVSFLVSATSLVQRALAAHFLQQREQSLRQQAEFDPLTGLANRTTFERALRHRLESAPARGERITLMFIDLDRFKPINDLHGHAIGDWLLRETADRLRQSLRADDLVARIGGDEFTVILDKLHDERGAARTASKLIAALARPFCRGELELSIGCSIGVACAPEHGRDADSLLHAADMAMYAAKKSGRGTWRMADSELSVT